MFNSCLNDSGHSFIYSVAKTKAIHPSEVVTMRPLFRDVFIGKCCVFRPSNFQATGRGLPGVYQVNLSSINVLTKMEKSVAENVLILYLSQHRSLSMSCPKKSLAGPYLLGHGVVVSVSKLSSRKIG